MAEFISDFCWNYYMHLLKRLLQGCMIYFFPFLQSSNRCPTLPPRVTAEYCRQNRAALQPCWLSEWLRHGALCCLHHLHRTANYQLCHTYPAHPPIHPPTLTFYFLFLSRSIFTAKTGSWEFPLLINLQDTGTEVRLGYICVCMCMCACVGAYTCVE